MPVYYLDTSALVKRYVQEPGTDWILSLTNSVVGNEFFTNWMYGPEIIAALARKERMGEISIEDKKSTASAFKMDWKEQYQIVEITAQLAEDAMELADKYGLRGYDVVHLAAAVVLHNLRNTLNLSVLTFLSADIDQLQAASAEGLEVDNPGSKP